jgi:hypothetical protein
MDVWTNTDSGYPEVIKTGVMKCRFCNRSMFKWVIHYRGWSKLDSDNFLFCDACVTQFERKTPIRNIAITQIVLIVDKVPPYAELQSNRCPQLVNTKNVDTVFDSDRLKSDVDVDKTVYAHMPSIEGAQIGDHFAIKDGKDVKLKKIEQVSRILGEEVVGRPISWGMDTEDVHEQLLEDKRKKLLSESGKSILQNP